MPKRTIENWTNKKKEFTGSFQKLTKKLTKLNEKKINQLADVLHESVFKEIDCLNCANCCKSIPPIINENDIRRIAKHLGIKVNDFKEKYVKYDEDMDMVLNQSPCTFLQNDNKCRIYECRPKACREYPHTNNFEFSRNIKLHATNSNYCPAVYYILTELSSLIQK